MSKTKQIIAAILAILGIGGGIAYSQLGGTEPGLFSAVGTSTQQSLKKNGGNMIFATSTSCISRIITTRESAILIAFNDKVATPTPETGHVQAASSTVTYDSTVYGCGKWTALPFGDPATTLITVTEQN